MNQTVQKCSRRYYNCFPLVEKPRIVHDPHDFSIFDNEFINEGLSGIEALFLFHDLFHGKSVELLIALNSGRLNSRALGPV